MIISAINKFIRLINPNLIIKLRPTNFEFNSWAIEFTTKPSNAIVSPFIVR